MGTSLAQMRGGHHCFERRFDSAARIGQECGNPGQRFIRFCIKHMQNCTDQQRMAGLFPMIALLKAAFGIDQHVCNILDIADLADTAAHFE